MFRRSTTLFLIIAASRFLFAGDEVFEITDIGYEQIYYGGFVLNDAKQVTIQAVGAGANKEIRRVSNSHLDKNNMFAYAWILNSETREMVWRMTIDNTEEEGWSDWNRAFDGKVRLDAGEYEVYFSAVEPSLFFVNGGFVTLGKVLKKIFSDSDDWDDDAGNWMIKISGADETFDQQAMKKYLEKRRDKALIQIIGSSDSKHYSRGFSLTKPLSISIYAIGEGFKGQMYDFGYIVDAQSLKQVWKMRETDTDYAGGAEKNRVINDKIFLEAGDYMVYYQLDGSHSQHEWNSNPPYDPFYWGLTIYADDKSFDPSVVKKFTQEEVKPILSITEVGDYAYKEAGLRINKKSKIRIYAMGEGRDGDMFDYAWISDASNGETVWKMKYRNTGHAGGASKNRLYEGIIELDAGEYVVYYQSDDSHSYEDWNMSAPNNEEMWGITIYPVGEQTGAEKMNVSAKEEGRVLAQLVRVGDGEHLRKQFHLDRKTRIRVYCLGEGEWDEMYDYGWIKNAESGETVWKMRYNKTQHGGGAKKNRMTDTIITLKRGTYMVHYISDDSHSYYDWNERAPHDKRNWGITVYNLSE